MYICPIPCITAEMAAARGVRGERGVERGGPLRCTMGGGGIPTQPKVARVMAWREPENQGQLPAFPISLIFRNFVEFYFLILLQV